MANNYCNRPFTELHIEENGNITPCCVMPSNVYFIANGIKNYFQNDKLKEIKDFFIKNKRHPYCQFCWDAEDNGVRSHRHDNKRPEGLYSLHIRFNNICNFKCRICNPKFSSTWLEENKKHNYYEHDYNLNKNIFESTDGIQKLILSNKNTIKRIQISGGEPLLTKLNYDFLTFLIKHNLTHIHLNYSTNLSTLNYGNINLLELFSQFDNVGLSVSIDGFGKQVEYSRSGFNWDIFIKNFKKARGYIKHLVCTVSIYALYSIPKLHYFALQNNILISYQPCLYPKFLSIQSLPYDEKLKVLKFYNTFKKMKKFDQLENDILNYMLREDIIHYQDNDKDEMNCQKEFKKYNTILDDCRDESFTEIFPQFKEWYDSIQLPNLHKKKFLANFCNRPFTELMLDVNGTIAPCCVLKGQSYKDLNSYLNSDYLSKIRNDFLTDLQPSECETCWKSEAKNAWSNRTIKPMGDNSDDVSKGIIRDIHIKFSNKCNLKCRMCNEYYSSAWGEEKKLSNPISTLFDNKNIKKQFYDLLPTLNSITMSGGEPFLSDDHLDFLKVASQINPDLNLIYNSNMTMLKYKDVYFPDFWNKFNNVTVIASVDGYGVAGSYQRYGFNWDKIASNILEVKEYVKEIHTTVTIYTIFSLPKLIEWCINNKINIKFYSVSQDFLNPALLPQTEKNKILILFKGLKLSSDLRKELIQNFIRPFRYTFNNSEELIKQFKKYTDNLDKIRNQSFINIVPELKDWYLSIKGD